MEEKGSPAGRFHAAAPPATDQLTRYLRATTEVAARLTSLLDFDAVLTTVVETLVQDFDAALARIWLAEPGSRSLYLRAESGPARRPSESPGTELHYEALPIWIDAVVRSGHPFVLPTPGHGGPGLRDDPRFDQAWLEHEKVAAVAAFPLLLGGNVDGVMVLFFGKPVIREVVDILASFAAIVTASLNDVQLFVREQEARAEAEEAQQRSAFLAEASRVLAGSLDPDTTLANIAQLVVPQLADWCVVDVMDADRVVRRLTVAHVDPQKRALAAELQERYPADENSDRAINRVLQTGEPILVQEISDESIAATARDPEHLKLLRGLGLRSFMCVPLMARGQVRGAISFVSAGNPAEGVDAPPGPGRYYDADDLELAEDLARRMAIAVDNARLYQDLQESIRMRDELLSTVSHDLKNPLAAIRGRTQMLQRRLGNLPSDEEERFNQGLESIDSAVTRMTRLINDLVDLARLRLGHPLEIEREPVDLVQLVRRELAQEQTLESHPVQVEAADEPLVVEGDPTRLERVIANLVSNAVKYSPPESEIKVELRRQEGPKGPQARIVVHDHGIGIPADDLPYIFERFHRGANVQGRIEGAGIGLAGAKQIVEQHGGTISVQSEEGQGASFTVELPLST